MLVADSRTVLLHSSFVMLEEQSQKSSINRDGGILDEEGKI